MPQGVEELVSPSRRDRDPYRYWCGVDLNPENRRLLMTSNHDDVCDHGREADSESWHAGTEEPLWVAWP